MKLLRSALWVTIPLLLSFQNTARAQSTTEPIIAKQRQISYNIQPDGSKTFLHKHEGAFYRSSSGASMNTLDETSTFIDEQGNTYEINHTKKVAKLVQTGSPLPHEIIKNIRPEWIQGFENVNGLECAIRPILVNGEPGGKNYSNLTYGLQVKSEWTEPGGSHLMVRELYDVKVAEPDPALVRIPDGYSLITEQ
ncbi:MAG: hypothetical protein AB1898_00835 [Acidobacteriota bacterium]